MEKLLYSLLRDHTLEFTQRLKPSCSFLKEFIEFERKLFEKEDKMLEEHHSDPNINTLHDFFVNIFNSQFIPTKYIEKGSALLGKTDFNKLGLVKNYLFDYPLALFDYKKEASIPSINKDIHFVVIDNCDELLKEKDTLSFFSSIPCDFKVHYILLGEENRLHEVIDINPNATVLMDEFLNKISMYEIT